MTDEELAALGTPEGDYQPEPDEDVTPPAAGDDPEEPTNEPDAPLPVDDGIPEQFRGKTQAELAQIAMDNKRFADRSANARKALESLGYAYDEKSGEYIPPARPQDPAPVKEPGPTSQPAVDPEIAQIEYNIATEKYNELLENEITRLSAEATRLMALGEDTRGMESLVNNEQVHEWLRINDQRRFNLLVDRAERYGKQQVQILETVADRRAGARVASLERQMIPAEISSTVQGTVKASGLVGLNDGDAEELAREISAQIDPEHWRTAPPEQREWFIRNAAEQRAYRNLVAKVQAMESETEPPARTPDPVGTTPPRQVAQVDARMTAQAEALMRDVPGLSKEDALDIVKRSK